MPGVNLDFLPASQAPEDLGSPDSTCAESGLEEAIGDLLAQEEEEDKEEQFCQRKFELTLQCAVGEIHCDLQAFGKRVDVRLEEAAAQVAPLVEAVARLQEENLRLRVQQETLIKQVEALCQVIGLPDPLRQVDDSQESSPSLSCDTKTANDASPTLPSDISTQSCDPPSCTSQETSLDVLPDPSNCTTKDFSCSATQDTQESNLLDAPLDVPQESAASPQDSESASTVMSTSKTSEPSPVQHPPTFASRRSLSAPSLMADIPCSDSTVLLSNGSFTQSFSHVSVLTIRLLSELCSGVADLLSLYLPCYKLALHFEKAWPSQLSVSFDSLCLCRGLCSSLPWWYSNPPTPCVSDSVLANSPSCVCVCLHTNALMSRNTSR